MNERAEVLYSIVLSLKMCADLGINEVELYIFLCHLTYGASGDVTE